MTSLQVPAASVDGLVAWYSVIHVPPSRHRGVYAGFHRALRADGLLLLAFQCGQERRRLREAYGHGGLELDAYRLRARAGGGGSGGVRVRARHPAGAGTGRHGGERAGVCARPCPRVRVTVLEPEGGPCAG